MVRLQDMKDDHYTFHRGGICRRWGPVKKEFISLGDEVYVQG